MSLRCIGVKIHGKSPTRNKAKMNHEHG
jgi:hypothetical protein